MIHSDINLRKYSTRYICGLQRLYQISQSWETVIYFLAVRVLIFRLFHLPLLVGSTFGKMVGNSYTLIRTSWASAEDKRWRPFWMLGPAQKCGWGEEKGRRGGGGKGVRVSALCSWMLHCGLHRTQFLVSLLIWRFCNFCSVGTVTSKSTRVSQHNITATNLKNK